jgi:nucleotide-binding universal stress UspA family protein
MNNQTLVPVDGTALSLRALNTALSADSEGSIIALHIQNPTDPAYGVPIDPDVAEEMGNNPEELVRHVTDEISERVQDVAEKYGHSIEFETRTGDPAREIIKYASEHDIDRIVIGSHGHEEIDQIMLGSVSQKVLRRAPVDVRVVRE